MSQKRWSEGSTADGEGEDGADDEPWIGDGGAWLGNGERGLDLEEDACDRGEPTLGAPDHIIDQNHWGDGGCMGGDGEEDDPAEDSDADSSIEDGPHDHLNEAETGLWTYHIRGGGSGI